MTQWYSRAQDALKAWQISPSSLSNQLGCALIFILFFPSPLFFSHYSVQLHPCSQACVIMEMPELFYKRESWSFITWKQRGRMQHQIQSQSNLWSLKIELKFILFPYNWRVRRKRDWLWLFTARKTTNDQQFLIICQGRIRCKEIKELWTILI